MGPELATADGNDTVSYSNLLKFTTTIPPQDIEEFERLVEGRGHTGGWEEADHLLFLRLRRQRPRGGTSFFSSLQAQLPGERSYERKKLCFLTTKFYEK